MYKIYPYLRFDNKCREALTLYAELLGCKATFTTIGEAPPEAQMKGVSKDKIMHASVLAQDGTAILAGSDLIGDEGYKYGNTVVLTLNCGTEDEIKSAFAKLSHKGKVTAALQDTFWGAKYAQVTDKYGVHWMLNYDKKQKK